MGMWRNWYTRRSQKPMVARPCGSKSHHAHKKSSPRDKLGAPRVHPVATLPSPTIAIFKFNRTSYLERLSAVKITKIKIKKTFQCLYTRKPI